MSSLVCAGLESRYATDYDLALMGIQSTAQFIDKYHHIIEPQCQRPNFFDDDDDDDDDDYGTVTCASAPLRTLQLRRIFLFFSSLSPCCSLCVVYCAPRPIQTEISSDTLTSSLVL
ncbi:uncharacterized protein LOC103317440 [Nasonia vitripennis]|uniref:Uncharacterized protein n=1 Tax=Nasonia vitripennis TaxID=7425 RepID=A0A7M7J2Z6_NASVI|nr:uncharacterized protein LOC103317440 [Nasonia vitripennis]